MTEAPTGPAIRDAATLILVRRDARRPQVLMGQRGAAAAFMPEKFVFPGGAVDAADRAAADLWPGPPAEVAARLAAETEPDVARALPFAAVRELWEETGLLLATSDPACRGATGGGAIGGEGAWARFAALGLAPRLDGVRFVFRAVTPPGRPRRFDARFFLAEASHVHGDPDDFSGADAELSALRWIDLAAARALPLPFITTVVLSEVEALLAAPDVRRPAPFFRHDARGSHMSLL